MWAFLQYLPLGCQRRLPAVSGSPACLGLRAAMYATIMTAAERLSPISPRTASASKPQGPGLLGTPGRSGPSAAAAPELPLQSSKRGRGEAGLGSCFPRAALAAPSPPRGKSSSPASSEARGLTRPFPPRVCRRPRCAAQDIAQPCGVPVRRGGPPLASPSLGRPDTRGTPSPSAASSPEPGSARLPTETGKRGDSAEAACSFAAAAPRRAAPSRRLLRPSQAARAAQRLAALSARHSLLLRSVAPANPLRALGTQAPPPRLAGLSVALLAEEPTSWLLVPARSASPAAAPRAATPFLFAGASRENEALVAPGKGAV